MSKEELSEEMEKDYHGYNPFKLNRQLNIFNDEDIKRFRLFVLKVKGTHTLHMNEKGDITNLNIHTNSFEDQHETLQNFEDHAGEDRIASLHMFNLNIKIFTRERDHFPKCHIMTLCEDNPKHKKALELLSEGEE